MSRTDHASAVAAVKAMENSLLTHSDTEQLIAAKTDSEFKSVLSAKNADGQDLEAVWEMLRSYAPDNREMQILLYRNDFHDLKAVLKALISNRDPSVYFIKPSNVELEQLSTAFREKSAEGLPQHLRKTADEAYELLTRTMDGQLSDTLIDTAALSQMQEDAARFGGQFIQRYAQLTAACADIKTAYRCCLMKKPGQFLQAAICGSRGLPKEDIIDAVLGGQESFFSYLETTDYAELASLLKKSAAAFEKRCDDLLIELADEARLQTFGIEPLEAYYIAKEAEIKNIRIIKVCRECGSDKEIITERMRKLYV